MEDLASIDATLASSVDQVGTIAQQAPCLCELTRKVHGRDSMTGGKRHNLITAINKERIVRDDQCIGAHLDK